MTTDHLFMDTTNSNIRFISTSSSSGDKGNLASNGEDISLNSLVRIYDRFRICYRYGNFKRDSNPHLFPSSHLFLHAPSFLQEH